MPTHNESTTQQRSRQRVNSLQALTRAQARDKVARNVVLLCETPTGQTGRPSKALTFDQAHALMDRRRDPPMGVYVLV